MKKMIVVFVLALFVDSYGQESFSNCSAVFLNSQMIVEEY
jgi:hypothetical protein